MSMQFGVGGISIDTTANSAAEAQTSGIAEAAGVGFRRVLDSFCDPTLRSGICCRVNIDQFVDFYHISEKTALKGVTSVLDYASTRRSFRPLFVGGCSGPN